MTEEAQTPRYGKLRDPDFDRGDFVFLLPSRKREDAVAIDPSLPRPDSQESMVEIMAWASIAASDDVTQFETYLQDYPDGHFAPIARRKVESLQVRDAGGKPEDQPIEVVEEDKPLKITAEQEIIEVSKTEEQDDWLPMAPSQTEAPIKIAAETQLDARLASGPGKTGQVLSKAGGMQDGLPVDPKDWKFSNPQGDGAYKAVGKWVHMKVGGGHNIWDCRRHQAPILSVAAPRTRDWTAQVKFEMPSRVGRSQVGLLMWNGKEKAPVYALAIGPTETNQIMVAGSYRDDCSAHSYELAKIKGNTGDFQTSYAGASGWLRVSKKGNLYSFYFKSPFKKQWQELGTVLATVKDGFEHVGLITKTWGNQSVQVSFPIFV